MRQKRETEVAETLDARVRAALVAPRADRRTRYDAGRAVREAVPLGAHAELGAPPQRDVLKTLRAQDGGRVAALVPIRWGRMSVSPFTFYRGAAAAMAADLAATPRTDLRVRLCGDAHLSNFGLFAAPDRRLVFDLNDFDEALPGPFEWDVKRLAASLAVAGRNNGLAAGQGAAAAAAAVRAYRAALATAAAADPLDVWYYRVELEAVIATLRRAGARRKARRFDAAGAKAERKGRLRAFARLTEVVDGRRRIREQPPLITRFPPAALDAELDRVADFFAAYQATLTEDRRYVLARYALRDLSSKVVGVGSVGTRCLLALFESGDGDPLFLQLKEAGPSVLEPYLGAHPAGHGGQRVVEGQRVLQTAPDVFLGWSRYEDAAGGHDYYVRQLWDGKGSVVVEELGPKNLARYAELCGTVLARAHARSGDAAAISGYLGDDDAFDRAVTAFATAYADRNDADYRTITSAIGSGDLPVVRNA